MRRRPLIQASLPKRARSSWPTLIAEQQFSGSTFHSSSSWGGTVIIRRLRPYLRRTSSTVVERLGEVVAGVDEDDLDGWLDLDREVDQDRIGHRGREAQVRVELLDRPLDDRAGRLALEPVAERGQLGVAQGASRSVSRAVLAIPSPLTPRVIGCASERRPPGSSGGSYGSSTPVRPLIFPALLLGVEALHVAVAADVDRRRDEHLHEACRARASHGPRRVRRDTARSPGRAPSRRCGRAAGRRTRCARRWSSRSSREKPRSAVRCVRTTSPSSTSTRSPSSSSRFSRARRERGLAGRRQPREPDRSAVERSSRALRFAGLGDVGAGLAVVDVEVGRLFRCRELVELLEVGRERRRAARAVQPRTERLTG